jgi:hypothetical protein
MLLAAGAVMLLVALYVLSVGPMAWLVDRNYVDGNSPLLSTFYAPLGWLAAYCQPVERALEWYMDFCR